MAEPITIQWLRFDFTVPAGTLASAPASQIVNVGLAEILDVVVRVPPGHMGTTGFAIEYSGSRILPFGGVGDWLIADNERLELDLNIEVGGRVKMIGYNTDVHDHTFYVAFHVDLLVGEGRSSGPVALEVI